MLKGNRINILESVYNIKINHSNRIQILWTVYLQGNADLMAFCLFYVFGNKWYSELCISEVYEKIKKYKLTSSEGVNKVGNRVIRFETLYNICINSDDSIKDHLQKISEDLANKLEQRKWTFDKLEDDDIININD